MKNKKSKMGYMLTESVVAIAIILIMTAFFVTLAVYVNTSFKKSTIITYGINHIENVQTIFLASTFTNGSSQISYINFENSVENYYEFSSNSNTNNLIITIPFTTNMQNSSSGNVKIEIKLNYIDNQTLTFSSKILNSGKIYYSQSTPLERQVVL